MNHGQILLSSQLSPLISPTGPLSGHIELVVNTRQGETHVRESTRILGQRVRRKTEEVYDHTTGQTVFRTLEFTEKEIEYEVVSLSV